MEKSIETIWKEGFIKNDALIAPKINNLYGQKSKHLIDKLKHMLKMNHILILILAFFNLGLYIFIGSPYAGALIFLLLIGVYWKSVRQNKNMVGINAGLNSYDYLKSFDNWIKRGLDNNVKTMRFFYPIIFMASLAPIIRALKEGEVTNKIILESGWHLIAGIPTFLWIVFLIITVIMFIFGGKIYRWDVNLFYGRIFKKIDTMIADMEDLKSP